MDYRDKVKEIHKYLEDSKIYINTNRDVDIQDVEGGTFQDNSARLFTVLTGMISGGSMIMVGGKGEAKTRLVKAAGVMFTGLDYDELKRAIVRGNPEQTEEKMIGHYEMGPLLKDGKEIVDWKKFITSPWRVVDEVNRLPPAKTSILYSLLAENEVEYQGESLDVIDSRTFATMIWEDKGTYQMTPPFLDRWGVAAPAYQATVIDEAEILDGDNEKLGGRKVKEVLESAPKLNYKKDWPEIYKEVRKVEVDPDAMLYIITLLKDSNMCERSTAYDKSQARKKVDAGLCENCHFLTRDSLCKEVIEGISTRTGKEAIESYSKALAYFLDSPVTTEIVEAVVPYVAIHRSDPNPKGKFEKEPFYGNDEIGFWRWFAAESKRKLPDRKAFFKKWSDVTRSRSIDEIDDFLEVVESAANADMIYKDLIDDFGG